MPQASLQRLREEEAAQRQRFYAEVARGHLQGQLLEGLFSGLADGPPYVELNLRDPDLKLPEIDLPQTRTTTTTAAAASQQQHQESKSVPSSPCLAPQQQPLASPSQQQHQQQQEKEKEKEKEGLAAALAAATAEVAELRKKLALAEAREAALLQGIKELDARLVRGERTGAGDSDQQQQPKSPALLPMTTGPTSQRITGAEIVTEGERLLKRIAQQVSELTSSLENSRLNSADLELKYKAASQENTRLNNENRALRANVEELTAEKDIFSRNAVFLLKQWEEAKAQLEKVKSEKALFMSEMSLRAALAGIEVFDIAVFVRTPRGHYEALTLQQPHRYLSEETVRSLEPLGLRDAQYVIGRVVEKARCVATAEFNPYGLPPNTPFYILTAEVLSRPPGTPLPSSLPIPSSVSVPSVPSPSGAAVEGKRQEGVRSS